MRIAPASPQTLVTEYVEAKVALDQLQSRLNELGERLIKQMEADQRKSFRWRAGGVQHSMTYVARTTTAIDEPGLRKALGAKIFDRYTKRVLDRKAMEAAMDSGDVDPVTVSKYVNQSLGKPYLKYTEGVAPSTETERDEETSQ